MSKVSAVVAIAVMFGIVAVDSGCSGSGSGSMGKARAALIGGTESTGDPAVVVLGPTGDDGGECSAVFVSDTVVLTAAHCVTKEDTGAPLKDPVFKLYRGRDIRSATDADWIVVDAKDVHPHPSYKGEQHDIAVMVLRAPVDVKPLPLSRRALTAADIGKTVRLIGYGANVDETVTTDDDGFGVKRELTTTIASLTNDGFVQVGKKGQTSCGGDSGGPALLEIDGVETIIGLDSFGDADIDCTEGEFYQRVDAEMEFIEPYLKAEAPPVHETDDERDAPAAEREPEPEPEPAPRAASSCATSDPRASAGAARLAPLFFIGLGLVLRARRRRGST